MFTMGIYQGEFTKEISFPLGGIGSGSIGLAGNGRLMDWEIFNRPNKGSVNGYSHLAVKAVYSDGRVAARVLNGDLLKDYTGQYGINYGQGALTQSLCGLPHFRDTVFTGEFPIATVSLEDPEFPAKMTLTAFNPLIPLDEDNSSLPAAFFEVAFHNTSSETLDFTAALSVCNPFAQGENRPCSLERGSMVQLCCSGIDKDDPSYGDLAIATDCPRSGRQLYWYRGGWMDSIVTFWREFSQNAPLSDRQYRQPGKGDTASVTGSLLLSPGEKASVRFILSWNVPNNYNYWNPLKDGQGKDITWKNFYATRFADAAATARYALSGWNDLYRRTLRFQEILFHSTLDPAVIDAASSTLSVIKSATVFRLEDGSLYGFEGTNEKAGSCEGSCTHVWNYAYAVPFLFPRLERSMRQLEYRYNQFPDGHLCFRLPLPLGRGMGWEMPCVDGQMGGVVKVYREWKISGDDGWLRSIWPSVKASLEYAWSPDSPYGWDQNRDGVLEGCQHHTLDMCLFGPSPWLEGFYLAALKAGAEMAEYLGEPDAAQTYRELFQKGSAWTEEHLFNGSYYIQDIALRDRSVLERYGEDQNYWNEETGEIKYQIGEGCDIDQLCGQWHATLCGLGDIFDPARRKTALESLYRNNFKSTFRDFYNPWRIFGLNDERGAVICDYPEGSYKPAIPVPYCEESMHGFEYQLAGLLASEGMVSQGLELVRAVRERYNGRDRNPYNEIECGSNYARSMASFALLPIFSGFSFDLARGVIGFHPLTEGRPFSCLWSLATGWGQVEIGTERTVVLLEEGELPICRLRLPYLSSVSSVRIDGKETDFAFEGGELSFAKRRVKQSVEVTV